MDACIEPDIIEKLFHVCITALPLLVIFTVCYLLLLIYRKGRDFIGGGRC